MTNKLKFLDNKPTEITLLHDQPIMREGKFGTYFLYEVEHRREIKIFCANQKLDYMIKATKAKKGDKLSIIHQVQYHSVGSRSLGYKILTENSNTNELIKDLETFKQEIIVN